MSQALKFLKSTLRLPASKFPPRPPPTDITKYLSRCDNLYAWQLKERPATTHETFTLHDGPPYANGDLHVGHALNKIVKDIICRTQLAQGKRINYIPGWDCHGLPIELKALEKHGWTRGSDVSPVKLRGAAKGFASKAVQKQMQGFRSWGVMGDWENHWKTMDKDFEIRQLSVFKSMVKHGLIFRRNKPVFWSPSSQTALAEAEIERDTHKSTAALIKFPIPAMVEGSAEPVHAVIFTTTPWTIPANQAIAIHKDHKYVIVKSKKHGHLIVGLTRVEYLAEQTKEDLEIIKTISAEDLINSTYSGLPQVGEDAMNRPIIHADFVSEEEGTGLVHCAPGHGPDDYNALQDQIKSGRVQVKAPVNDLGEFTSEATATDPSLLVGQNVFKEGNESVLKLLDQQSMLLAHYKFTHKYPIDWRTKQPIIIRATPQWFADVSSIKADVLRSLDNVKFLPAVGASRLRTFVENRSEWCISRQRAWGVPIPALYHKDTNEAVLTPESIDHIISTIHERGIDCWWADDPHDPAWVMPDLNPDDYVRGTDTMDVWFDSGTSWALMAEEAGNVSQSRGLANVYLEGSDQHRGWFQSSLLTNIAYQKAQNPTGQAHAPFQTLVTHGFTLDGDGKKMSKSLGNVIAPSQIIAGLAPQAPTKKGRTIHPLGPDALRLWAASSDWSADVVVSESVVSAAHRSLDKYRVTIKLLLGMLADFDPTLHLTTYNPNTIDRIALHQLHAAATSTTSAMSTFQFHKAVSTINEWVARDLSGFYFEAIKDVIYCDSPHSPRRIAAQTTLFHILSHLQSMLGPITPLLVEESHDFTPPAIQAHAGHPLQRIQQPLPDSWNDTALSALLPDITALNSGVKSALERGRAEKVIGQSLAADVEIFFRSEDTLEKLKHVEWEQLLVVSKVTLSRGDYEVFTEFSRDRVESHRANVRVAVASRSGQQNIGTGEDGVAKWAFCQEVTLQGSPEDQVDAYVIVRPPTAGKCDRCWRYVAPKPDPEAAESKKEEGEEVALCERCVEVVEEVRTEDRERVA